ncbi:MAG: hypothetical protein PWP30_2258 [Eubacteriaceae bacterium]|nr:hypothetical protein [Eubacteriaceae bacterium]
MNIERENFTPESAVDVSARRSEEFNRRSQTLSKFIEELPISPDQNDKLIALIVNQIGTGEVDAFKYGVEMGLNIGKEFYQG